MALSANVVPAGTAPAGLDVDMARLFKNVDSALAKMADMAKLLFTSNPELGDEMVQRLQAFKLSITTTEAAVEETRRNVVAGGAAAAEASTLPEEETKIKTPKRRNSESSFEDEDPQRSAAFKASLMTKWPISKATPPAPKQAPGGASQAAAPGSAEEKEKMKKETQKAKNGSVPDEKAVDGKSADSKPKS